MELELQVPSTTELYSTIDNFRGKFKEAIRDYVFMEYTEEYKFESTYPILDFRELCVIHPVA